MASTIKVDEIKEKTVGSGITLGHALKNSSGTEIMSAAGVFSSNIDGGTISNATLDSSVTFSSFVGLILPFAYDTSGSPPSGFFECDGSAVSRTTYSDLFSAIGTTWGVGDGSSTFNIPDLQGAFLRGTGTQIYSSVTYTGQSVGSFENDSFQGHYHDSKAYAFGNNNNNANKELMYGNGLFSLSSLTGGGTYDPTSDGTNGTPRIGDETRPFNAGVMYCIKY